MKNKLLFLTKMSLNKKIKTKWFYIANVIFLLLIVAIMNIDTVIKFFGGDFDEAIQIKVIDNINEFDNFKNTYEAYTNGLEDYVNVDISKYDKNEEEFRKEHEEDDILLILNPSNEDLISVKVISETSLGTVTKTLLNASLNEIYKGLALKKHNISAETYADLNKNIIPEIEILSDDEGEDVVTVSLMQILTFPLFMLIIFLVQMIGAEVNEEKSTKSMEIIISNVSPKTHFISKILSANLFVLIQGGLLIVYAAIGIAIRLLTSPVSNLMESMDIPIDEYADITGTISGNLYIIPVIIIMIILTFLAYSLLAGILASMTTNQEDYQQLQTPIVIVSLVGYYLSMMASLFKGSLFIRIMSYIPFVSSTLAPTLLVLGDITIFDLCISIALLIGAIYLLMHYGLRIYKVGILNYSGTNLWKKMFAAIRR